MMIWILIVMAAGSGRSFDHIEFANQTSCLQAKAKVDKVFDEIANVRSVCVPKNSEGKQ